MTSSSLLNTGIKLVKNVGSFNFGSGSVSELAAHVEKRRCISLEKGGSDKVVYFVDEFFRDSRAIFSYLAPLKCDRLEYVGTADEPTTAVIDRLVALLAKEGFFNPATLVGLGGGITLDTTKAVANLLTNGGLAEQYQGWDLVRVPAIHKIGVPTISGTGAEATRTCVLTNTKTGLKLGMNSDHTVFDHLILDSDLTATVPRNQYFYTGMDAYIHCVESLAGSYRNAIGDAYSRETLNLCRQVFLSDDMMSAKSRENLMVASFLGGCAIATSYVGIVHPFSAGLSVVLKLHHCVANCVVLRALGEFYPEAREEMLIMMERQGVSIPENVCSHLSETDFKALYDATIIHQKPLTNALGEGYREVLTFDKVRSIFQRM